MIKSSNYEILGIGAPSVDLILEVSEASLKKVSATKGGMTVIDHNSLIKIIEESQTIPKMITGGSAANTIKGLANFGRKCALLGKLGQDLMGEKFLKNINYFLYLKIL